MKKTILVFFLCICTLTAACSAPSVSSKLTVLEIGAGSNTSDEGSHIAGYEMWSDTNCNPHEDSAAAKNAEIVFNGKTYVGEYRYSIVEMYNLHVSDYYTASDGRFSINRENGQLETLALNDFNAGDKSFDDCTEIAENIARQYIDLSNYTLVSTEGDPVHSYQFIKMMNGIETNDVFSLGVSSSGKIATLTNFTHKEEGGNAFANGASNETNSLIERFISSDAVEKVEAKVKEIYNDCLSYSIASKRIVELENSELGMIYTVDVELAAKASSDGYTALPSEMVELLVRGS